MPDVGMVTQEQVHLRPALQTPYVPGRLRTVTAGGCANGDRYDGRQEPSWQKHPTGARVHVFWDLHTATEQRTGCKSSRIIIRTIKWLRLSWYLSTGLNSLLQQPVREIRSMSWILS